MQHVIATHTFIRNVFFKFYRERLSLKLHIIYISHTSVPFRMILQTSLWHGKTDITVRNSLHKNITVKPNFVYLVLFTNMCQKWRAVLFLTKLNTALCCNKTMDLVTIWLHWETVQNDLRIVTVHTTMVDRQTHRNRERTTITQIRKWWMKGM